MDLSPIAARYLPTVEAVAIVAFSLLAGLLFRRVLVSRLARLAAEKTAWKWDEVIVDSLRRVLPVWFFLAGLYAAFQVLESPERLLPIAEKVVLSTLIVSITVWTAHRGIRFLGTEPTPRAGAPAAATGFVRDVVRVCVLVIGGLVLLGTLGISITPLLTTIGLGGLAVALGLRETMTNLFAGMQLTTAGNFHVGDFIKIESEEQGYVQDIGWRATRVLTIHDNLVVIPNSKLVGSVVTNYHQPSSKHSVAVRVGVHYASDLEHVERVAREVARSILATVPGGVPDFEPVVRYHTFGESSIELNVTLRVQEFRDGLRVKHDFMKALASAFAREKIVMPAPIRALNLEQEGIARKG